jgi:peptidoglycan/LPS O-acetylase OafA/YrhL
LLISEASSVDSSARLFASRDQNLSSQDQNFVLLDGLRGVGAGLILFGHSASLWGGYYPPIGAVMVDLFFLLSGFVIAYAYEPKLRAGMGTAEFMQHRIVRLYPLYLLGAVLGLIVLSLLALREGKDIGFLFMQFFPALAGVPSPVLGGVTSIYPLNPPSWTLFFELFANLIYALCFRWLRHTRVLIAVTAAFAVSLVIAVYYYDQIHIGMDWRHFFGGFARAGFGFFAGVLAFRLVGSPTRTKRPASNWTFVLMVALPLICLFPVPADLRVHAELFVVIGLGIPILLLSQVMEPPARYVALFLSAGRISYAMYILHVPLAWLFLSQEWRFYLYGLAPPIPGLLLLALMIGIAWAAEKYYDRPVRRAIVAMIRKNARQRSRQTPAAFLTPAE